MSKRLEKFRSLKDHLVIGVCFKHLGKKEIEMCEKFILDNDHLDQHEFAFTANRWMLNVPSDQRPSQKKYSAMWALIIQSN